jgi:trigger factor
LRIRFDWNFHKRRKEINNETTISLDVFKDKATADKFIGKKVGDVVTVNTKDLFEDAHQLMDVMKVMMMFTILLLM